MRSTTTILAAALAAGGLALSAPGALAQTPAHVGTYTLAQVQGQPLPVQTDADADGCREEVLSATLTLEADGDWEMEYVERETCGDRVDEDREEADGDYEVDGATIRFSDDDESDEPAGEIDVDELGVATLGADGLSVQLQDRRTTLVFRR